MSVHHSGHASRGFIVLAVAALTLALGLVSVAWSQEMDTEQVRSQRISLNLQNVTLGSVLKVMTQKSGINFLIGSDLVGKTINVYLEDVLVEDALAAIMRANGLWYTRQKGTNIYVITDAPEGPPVVTVTEVLRTSYADANELAGTLQSVLTETGSIVVDGRTNSLVVSDIPENMSTLQSLVTELDDPTSQVLIEARIVEFSEDAAAEIGLNWGYADFEPGEDGNGEYSYGSTFDAPDHEGFLDLTFGKFTSFQALKDLQAMLSVMQKDGKAQVLAEPRILTLDNKEASIEITEHIALAKKTTYREGGQEQTVEPIFGDVGVTLKVTPNINTDEFVTLKVEPVVSSAQKSSFFPNEAVDTRKRSATTTVMVKDGETIVIGGLLRKDVIETRFKVPLLGDIPILGYLFSKSILSDTTTEVVLFLTPRILGSQALANRSERIESEIKAKMGE